jgi:hypothetical protein
MSFDVISYQPALLKDLGMVPQGGHQFKTVLAVFILPQFGVHNWLVMP